MFLFEGQKSMAENFEPAFEDEEAFLCFLSENSEAFASEFPKNLEEIFPFCFRISEKS